MLKKKNYVDCVKTNDDKIKKELSLLFNILNSSSLLLDIVCMDTKNKKKNKDKKNNNLVII